jgi:hypothetical protein
VLAPAAADKAPADASSQEMIIRIERRLELERHAMLLERIRQPDTRLNDFTTDGCSGGMSAGWQLLAEKIPRFHASYGDHPPWEACCETHDRAYHRGGKDADDPLQSFTTRRRADLALRQCVITVGRADSPLQSKKFNISKDEILRLYTIAAELMFRAVRIGGMPCTALPWRWGYGWPQCE